VQQPALRQVVVLYSPMLHGAIVPEQQIARLPLVAVDESWLDNVIG
jgi:hypothetical protein